MEDMRIGPSIGKVSRPVGYIGHDEDNLYVWRMAKGCSRVVCKTWLVVEGSREWKNFRRGRGVGEGSVIIREAMDDWVRGWWVSLRMLYFQI